MKAVAQWMEANESRLVLEDSSNRSFMLLVVVSLQLESIIDQRRVDVLYRHVSLQSNGGRECSSGNRKLK